MGIHYRNQPMSKPAHLVLYVVETENSFQLRVSTVTLFLSGESLRSPTHVFRCTCIQHSSKTQLHERESSGYVQCGWLRGPAPTMKVHFERENMASLLNNRLCRFYSLRILLLASYHGQWFFSPPV